MLPSALTVLTALRSITPLPSISPATVVVFLSALVAETILLSSAPPALK
ncbi:hypothetical protein [Sinorhizobium medicae]|nr:hypothetical protein [Sinorhizobium medicae]